MLDNFSWANTLILRTAFRIAADAQTTRAVESFDSSRARRRVGVWLRAWEGTLKRESACKPGSVGGSHSSAMCVAAHL